MSLERVGGARVTLSSDAMDVPEIQTVKDVVAGSGFEFNDRGEHELRAFRASGAYTRSQEADTPRPSGPTT